MADLQSAHHGAAMFLWLASRPLPTSFDLRTKGWKLGRSSDCGEDPCLAVGFIDIADAEGWSKALSCHGENFRRGLIVTGADSSQERGQLLRNGFGDAIGSNVDLDELDARAMRVAEMALQLPRIRAAGELKLDLLAREAHRGDTPLNLNPREFALIWRLAENINQPVSKQTLIRDVWHMGFIPETNSIAVHMSRLRRKLAFVGIKGIIETVPSGGYALRSSPSGARGKAAAAVTGNCGNEPIAVPLLTGSVHPLLNRLAPHGPATA